ncbi:hypothetical protein G6045_00195 [Streptomyces sp. YC504]|uniref:Uncharacterized protein n=1 Tax=Streptomyces mesophilus TaxID=1775132 RepID=A0A6G4X999_9ACTN|nr:beta-ketoacyl synthase N-terminal-like domain-containing protein [Streptomyces mesophilus]NGO74116.1 hypothetical protein [Streptomyces mesophilus]
MSAHRGEAVAVVGMGLVVPGASSPQEFWRVLCQDEPQFGPPDERWDLETLFAPELTAEDRVYRREMGYVTGFRPHADIDRGAPADLDSEAGRWLRHCLLQATEGIGREEADRWLLAVGAAAESSQRLEESLVVDRVATLLCEDGRRVDEVRRSLQDHYPQARATPASYLAPRQVEAAASGVLPDDIQISVLQGACSGSLQALDAGLRALRSGECDIAVCGSTFVLNRLTNVLCSVMRAAPRTGGVRPFDKGADGTVFSEGAGLLTLKRYDRAVADGDRIHGVLLGTGASTDGPGTSIVTPNPKGQQLAVRRALRQAGIVPANVQWIIAHGTGTRAGDAAELRMLGELVDGARWQVSSNKALIGHTGWTAGVASVIHGLLAMEHELIPAQRQFDEVTDPALLRGGALAIPTEDVAWRRRTQSAPRIAAVCAYGLGGVNGCAVISDGPLAVETTPEARSAHAGEATASVPSADDVVVTAWYAHLPGAPHRAAVERWLSTGAQTWADAFPTPYPPPPFAACRLPPATFDTLDRSHLMILDSAHGLDRELGGAWRQLAAETGVFLGHMGPTAGSVAYALRASMDDFRRRTGDDPLPGTRQLTARRLAEEVRGQVPRGISDTYTGLLCCIMASRVAVQYDLHGPALSFEAGPDSALAALEAARLQLVTGGVEFALVFAVAGNAEHGDALLGLARGRRLREGAFALALTRRSTAQRLKLPVLRRLERTQGKRQPPTEPRPAAHTGFLGADSAVRILRATASDAGDAVIAPEQDRHLPALRLAAAHPTSVPKQPPRAVEAFYLRETVERSAERARWRVPLDRDRDGFLSEHRVDGRPTMPGTLMLELAAEAATALVPRFLPQSFAQVEFEAFVRLPDTGRPPLTLKADAEVLHCDDAGATVFVRLLSDVTLPDGKVIQADRIHMSAQVRLSSFIGQRPYADDLPEPSSDAPELPDVYCRPNRPHLLSGTFDSLRRLRAHHRGGTALWRCTIAPDHPAFSKFRTPAVLLDAMFRTGQLNGEHHLAHEPPMPVGLSELTLYTQANDLALAGLFGSGVTLHHRPAATGGATDRLQRAIAPDGTVLAEVRGLRLYTRASGGAR